LTPRLRGALRRKLLAWYRAHRRDLPWRRTRDPYAIWISEAMLQQTRVETVIPYWERFLARFPDVEALATADVGDVTALWAGLGYYSRARNLHRAAQLVMDRHAGQLPDDVDALRALPGVGRYTAGALASIAFDKPAPIVDGNVARVLARLLGIDADVRTRAVQDRLWNEADQLARGEDPGALNQSLMELGATVCTPRAPRCDGCPWADACWARAHGRAEQLPVKSRASEPRRIEAVAAFLERGGRVLAVQRPQRGLLGGLWELPGGEIAADETPERALARVLREGIGLAISRARSLGSVGHAFTHRLLRLHVYRAEPGAGRVRRSGWDAHRWVSADALAALPLGGPTRKAVALVDARPREVRPETARPAPAARATSIRSMA
jgi:A/G-specific adenine glycosylase